MLGLSTIKNPLIVHIITEIIVLVGVVFWFSSKQKRLQLQIEKLLLRIEDQEDKIFKLENALEHLYKTLASSVPVSAPVQMASNPPVELDLDQELQEELADLRMEEITPLQPEQTQNIEELDTAQSLVDMNNTKSNLGRLKNSVKDLLSADLKKENIQ